MLAMSSREEVRVLLRPGGILGNGGASADQIFGETLDNRKVITVLEPVQFLEDYMAAMVLAFRLQGDRLHSPVFHMGAATAA
jgi:hypothetical protein